MNPEPRTQNPEPPPCPRVAVVVLNWNNRRDTEECLGSLARVEYPDLLTILVDNGSADGTVDGVRLRFPRVRIVENGANLGFAAGNNAGIRVALEEGADFVVLLNNDTIVDPGFVRELLVAWRTLPDAGFLGTRIFYHAEPQRIWMGAPTWDPATARFRHRWLNEEEPDSTDPGDPVETSYICGCALMFPRRVVDTVGLMDERFFCYYEEVDWCYRARAAGMKCYYVPRARIWHKVSATAGGWDSPLVTYYRTRNLLLWGERHLRGGERARSAWHVLTDLPGSLTWSEKGLYWTLRRIVWSFRLLLSGPGPRAWRRGIRDYCLRRFGRAPESIERLSVAGKQS